MLELGIAIPVVWLRANTGKDPLPRVPAEVQDQVPDAVRFFVRAPPNLLVREFLETALDLGR